MINLIVSVSMKKEISYFFRQFLCHIYTEIAKKYDFHTKNENVYKPGSHMCLLLHFLSSGLRASVPSLFGRSVYLSVGPSVTIFYIQCRIFYIKCRIFLFGVLEALCLRKPYVRLTSALRKAYISLT